MKTVQPDVVTSVSKDTAFRDCPLDFDLDKVNLVQEVLVTPIVAFRVAWKAATNGQPCIKRDVAEHFYESYGWSVPKMNGTSIGKLTEMLRRKLEPIAEEEAEDQGTNGLPPFDDLSATAQIVVRTLCKRGIFGPGKDKRLLGREIAAAAKIKFNTQYKQTLVRLKTAKIIDNPGRGYFLTKAGRSYCKKTTKSGQSRSGK